MRNVIITDDSNKANVIIEDKRYFSFKQYFLNRFGVLVRYLGIGDSTIGKTFKLR